MSSLQQVHIRRRMPAPIEEVFRWWTDPDLMARWMTPVGEVSASVDLRVGGSLRVVMAGEGMVIEHVGEFLEVDPPQRLVFTWTSRFTGGHASVVTVELEPDGDDASWLRLTHAELSEDAAKSHRGGWLALLDRLEALLVQVEARNGN
jgi:uncharacterized protein YndB with AHSA1/START domain